MVEFRPLVGPLMVGVCTDLLTIKRYLLDSIFMNMTLTLFIDALERISQL